MVTSTKLRETTRRGWIPTSPVASGNRQFLECITRMNGHDVVGLQKSGDIILVDPDTRVKRRFVPASGMTIEILKDQGRVAPRTANNGTTIVINRELESIPYLDDAVYATYNAAPTADLFDSDVIYVVEKDVFNELAISCALAGVPLPAIIAVPEDEVTDPAGCKIGYARLVIHQPRTASAVEYSGDDQPLFTL